MPNFRVLASILTDIFNFLTQLLNKICEGPPFPPQKFEQIDFILSIPVAHIGRCRHGFRPHICHTCQLGIGADTVRHRVL